jgi:hypothetical protein
MKALKLAGVAFLAVILVSGLVLSTGCQKAGERAAEKMMENALTKASGGKANVNMKDGKLSVTTKDGSSEFSMGGTTEWPADLILDIPKIEGKVKGVIRTTTAQGKNWLISLEGIAADVPSAYIKALESKGWTIGMNMTSAEGGSAQATKDQNQVVLTYSTGDKMLVLNVTAGAVTK